MTNRFLSANKGLATSLGELFKQLITFLDFQGRESWNLVSVDPAPDTVPASGLAVFSLRWGRMISELKPTWGVIVVAGWFLE